MILNLTQHPATPDQIAAGVIDLPAPLREIVVNRLTVEAIPTRQEILDRAHDIAQVAAIASSPEDRAEYSGKPETVFCLQAMIGGAPWMMRALEDALLDVGIEPVYAFSVRASAEEKQPDGSVRKVNTFRHAGFVSHD